MREYLKRFRAIAGLTQSEAAKKIGVSQQMYGFIENGNRNISNISIQRLTKLSSAFGVPINKLIAEEQNCSQPQAKV